MFIKVLFKWENNLMYLIMQLENGWPDMESQIWLRYSPAAEPIWILGSENCRPRKIRFRKEWEFESPHTHHFKLKNSSWLQKNNRYTVSSSLTMPTNLQNIDKKQNLWAKTIFLKINTWNPSLHPCLNWTDKTHIDFWWLHQMLVRCCQVLSVQELLVVPIAYILIVTTLPPRIGVPAGLPSVFPVDLIYE